MTPDSSSLPLRVLMLGPHPGNKGGIASVERLILARPPHGVELRFVATQRQGPAVGKARAFARALGAALPPVRGVDVAHLHFAPYGSVIRKAILAEALRAAGVPVVLHAHGAEFAEHFRAVPAPLRAAIRRALRGATRLVVLSESWRRFYRDEVGVADARIVVLPNPVQLPDAPPPRTGAPVRFVFLGRFGPRKGIFDLLEAFAALPDAVRERARLDAAGDGDVAGVRAAVARLGLGERVGVHAWLSPSDRDALLTRSHAFVLPSRNEGLPMALLEAMAWRLAAITTPVGGIPEFVRDGVEGRLVPPGDVAALRDALSEAVEDEAARLRRADAARAAVEPLGLDGYAERLGAAYRAAAEARGRRGDAPEGRPS